MTTYLFPYKLYSASARALKQSIRTLLVRPNGRFRPRRGDIIVNWGNTTLPNSWRWGKEDINSPDAVRIAANKLLTFQKLEEHHVPTPMYTTSIETARGWQQDGKTILARSLLSSHSGRGITVVQPDQELPAVPLYVEYKKKRAEYRVHVFKGQVIDTCIKRKRNEAERPENFNTYIRSYNNGWVFCRENLQDDPRRTEIALQAISALGLDFGAIDMIYNERDNQYYVLEINTAPGISGQTLTAYTNAITNLIP